MKFASRLLIFTVILLNICSCTEIVREKSEPTHLACWFTDKFPDSLYPGSYKIDGCCPGLSYTPNALCCFQNADGTFTIKKTSYVLRMEQNCIPVIYGIQKKKGSYFKP